MIFISIILENSVRAASSLSPINRRARAKTGAPVVGTVCVMPWAGGASRSKRDTEMLGNSRRSASTWLEVVDLRPQTSPESRTALAWTGTKGDRRTLSSGGHLRRRWHLMSMRRSCLEKKSAPSIGRGISAKKNSCTVCKPRKFSLTAAFPDVGIEVPLAACKEVVAGLMGPECKDVGKTDTSAPLSTRKSRPEVRSWRQSDRGEDFGAWIRWT